MAGTQADPRKWNMPGWRIEQKFAPGVLMGNWNEERKNFIKDHYVHNTTHRMDFTNYGTPAPDVILRRQGELNNQGLPAELLLHHNGNRYSNNMVTHYDTDFNGRWKEKKLPKLRTWNHHVQAWIPEKSDVLVERPPTNWGLLGKLQTDWAAQEADKLRGDYLTTYNIAYQDIPYDQTVRMRYATPKLDSTMIHPVNAVNKNLHLRRKPILKSPERLPVDMPHVCI